MSSCVFPGTFNPVTRGHMDLIERAAGSAEYPVVILENEISEAGVDNQLLRQNSFTVENIFAGCICCTSTAQMIYSASYHLKHLISA